MHTIRCRRHDRTFRYVACKVGTCFEPLPHWFQPLIAYGKLKPVDQGISVLTITGNWRLVREGNYVVLQENGDLWAVEAEDFLRTWYVYPQV